MENQTNLVISCFKDSFFYRSITDPKSINSLSTGNQSLIESMMIYQEVNELGFNKVTLNDVSYKNDKYYLTGYFIYGENKADAMLYPSSETVFNSDTKFYIIGEYESVGQFKDSILSFETSFGGYKTTLGGNYDGLTLIDMLQFSSIDVCKNYVDRIGGTLEEEFIYNKGNGLYTHRSNISRENEDLLIDPKYENGMLKKMDTKKDDDEKTAGINKYAYLKNQREILIREIQRQSFYEEKKKRKVSSTKRSEFENSGKQDRLIEGAKKHQNKLTRKEKREIHQDHAVGRSKRKKLEDSKRGRRRK